MGGLFGNDYNEDILGMQQQGMKMQKQQQEWYFNFMGELFNLMSGAWGSAQKEFGKKAGILEGFMNKPTSAPGWQDFLRQAVIQSAAGKQRIEEEGLKRGLTGGAILENLGELEKQRALSTASSLATLLGQFITARTGLQFPALSQYGVSFPGTPGINMPQMIPQSGGSAGSALGSILGMILGGPIGGQIGNFAGSLVSGIGGSGGASMISPEALMNQVAPSFTI